jgi:hypothetical protein
MCNEIFKGSEINVALLQYNIPIPCVEDRYKIIREYHETVVGGHRGMNKTIIRSLRLLLEKYETRGPTIRQRLCQMSNRKASAHKNTITNDNKRHKFTRI